MSTRSHNGDDADLPLSRERKVHDDVNGEVEFHLRERAAELEAQGMPPEQAAAEAAALFGDRDDVESACREIEQRRRVAKRQSFRWQSLVQDLLGGVRLLRSAPLFTAAAVLTLAIGVGANSAVFSLLNQVVLQPLSYPQPDRLVQLIERHERGWGNVSWANMLDLREQSQSFTSIASFGSGVTTVLGGETPARARVARISRDFYDVFGVVPERGRLPDSVEHTIGGPPVLLVSHAFWRDQLGAPESLAGTQITLDQVYDVIGVLPAGFDMPAATQLWRPLELDAQSMSRTSHNYETAGRMRAGVSPASAEQELNAIFARLAPIHAADFDAVGSTVTPLQDVLTADLKTPLYLLFAASLVLLLAACTNVASAQLARGAARQGELAIRSALGATRLRLVRQLLAESVVLSLLGAAAGLLVARVLLLTFLRLAPANLSVHDVSIDGWVLLFTLVVALLAAVGFGLYPALQLSEGHANQALREGGRATLGRKGMRVWNTLVAVEIAMAVMLLSGSQVLMRSFAAVMRTDLGFNIQEVATATVSLPEALYGDGSTVPRFHESVLSRVGTAPGIEAVGFGNVLPLGGGPNGSLEVAGQPLPEGRQSNGYAEYRVVGGDYFAAMGIRVLEGRALSARDGAGAPAVVVVDSVFAAKYWPDGNVIGQRVRPAGMDAASNPNDEPWATVVGVVASVRHRGATTPFQATYYFDHRQRPAGRTRTVSYAVRSPLEQVAVNSVLRESVHAVDAQVPVEPSTMSRVLGDAVAVQRFMMWLLGAFAVMALLLALVGIYAVVSFSVARRTREIGIRLALGCSPAQVVRLVLRASMRGVVPGLMIGALLAVLATRTLRSLLYGVSPNDPIALATAVFMLAAASVLSTWVPARRATRVDPLVAMRAE